MIPRYRIVESGFEGVGLSPLEDDEAEIRVSGPLTDEEYLQVASLLRERPEVSLHLWSQEPDVECLRHFAGLNALAVTNLRLQSWAGLRHVAPSLEHLVMGDTTLRPVSIAPMANLSRLESLVLIGPVKDADIISRLIRLETLTLRSVRLPDLGALVPLRRLRCLNLHLGGTADVRLLTELTALRELELWRIRGLSDVSVLGSLPRLERLSLQSMSAITELPPLGSASRLRWLALDTMKGITDLAPVAAAPALEELLLVDMPQLGPDSLKPLVGHATLRRGIWGFGSLKKNAAAYDALPLGDPPYGHRDWKP